MVLAKHTPNRTNHLHPNIEDMTILYFYHNLNISISLKRSNFTLVFFKAACHANPGAERSFAGSSSYISRHIFLKFSNASANNKVSF